MSPIRYRQPMEQQQHAHASASPLFKIQTVPFHMFQKFPKKLQSPNPCLLQSHSTHPGRWRQEVIGELTFFEGPEQ